MSAFDWILGRHLANSEEKEQRVGTVTGISMLGLDALSSSAYGPEAALTILLPLGALGLRIPSHHRVHHCSPLSWFIFPIGKPYMPIRLGEDPTRWPKKSRTLLGTSGGGGALTYYILNVAVGISAGVGALISAIPSLQPHTLALCLLILGLITLINLRGVRESGSAFLVPTYLFVVSLFAVLGLGLIKAVLAAAILWR